MDESLEDIVLELDEMWSFVQKKEQKVWLWIALSRTTRQVVGYAVGSRSAETCQTLWESMPEKYRQAQAYSDFWQAYQTVWGSSCLTQVGKESGETSHIERFNGTLRQRLAQFVRKTLSFSKCPYRHLIRIALFLHRYNLDRARNIMWHGVPFAG
ncbi:MAG: IS1 family transposase [Myxococcales bacterium]|nr:IS1 family transposase [Myxococcales bacterium]